MNKICYKSQLFQHCSDPESLCVHSVSALHTGHTVAAQLNQFHLFYRSNWGNVSHIIVCFFKVASSCFSTLSQCVVINPCQLTETPLHLNKCHIPPDSTDAELSNKRRNYAPELTAVIKASKAGCKTRLKLCCSSLRSILKYSTGTFTNEIS